MSSPAPESVPTAASRLSATPTGCGTNTASRTYATPEALARNRKNGHRLLQHPAAASCCRKSRKPDTTRSGNWKIISTWRSSRRTSTTCTSGPAARTSPTCTANCVNCAAAPTNRWSYRSKVGNNTLDDRAPDGSLLRPFVVFFGEGVPMFDRAARIARYGGSTDRRRHPRWPCIRPPRWYATSDRMSPVYLIDPNEPDMSGIRNPTELIRTNSAQGTPLLVDRLIGEFGNR